MGSDVWRNFINKPKLSNYITNMAEVGYSHYGPTFAVAGTLGSLNAVILVHNICAEVTSLESKASHFMDWFAFRPAHYVMGNFSGMDLTMASKFSIAPNHSHEHNTLFIDANRFSEMKSALTVIKNSWEEALFVAAKDGKTINTASLFAEFKDLKIVAGAMERLKTMNYWEPGEYSVKVRVTTENPKQFFDIKRNFVLKDADTQMLLNNVPLIISNICQQPHMTYACTTPALTIKK